jgi:glycosyltransferase involved in cell wall biosynthesis
VRILAITWGLSDHRGGGEPIGACELVRHLALAGARVDVVTPWVDVRRPLPEGVRVFPVRGGARAGNSGLNKWAMRREARRLQRRERYHVTHVVSQFTAFPIDQRPFVISGCWMFPAAESRRTPPPAPRSWSQAADLAGDLAFAMWEERLAGWTVARTRRDADLVIVRQRLGVEALAREARRVEHVPFGVDLEAFPVSADRREPVVVFAGHLKPYKNVDGLIRAWSLVVERHPAARLRIAGEGDERPRLEALAARLDVAHALQFLGYRSRSVLSEEYRRATALCLPSRGESFGLVCLEAMASGTPAVVSDRISGAYDFVDDGGNGFMAPADDPGALANRIAVLLDDPERARCMGSRARATAERFAWPEVARRHLELLGSL